MDDELRAEAGSRRRNGAPHDRFLASYRARMGYRGRALVPPAVYDVEGAIDIHCHAHDGQQDALAIAELASASGMKGLLFKSVTGMNRRDAPGPAAVVRAVGRELSQWCEEIGIEPVGLRSGWIVTDTRGRSVPEAARAEIEHGAAAVWMPVFRSANTLHKVGGPSVWWGGDSRAWSDPLPWEEALRVGAYTIDEHGALKPEYKEVFRIAADHDVMISFAHATHREIYAMADEASRLGTTKAVIDHPFSPFIDLSTAQARELASAGVTMNFTYDEISPLLGVDPARMCEAILAIGTEHVTLSSDAGEPLFPNTVEAIRLLRAYMHAFGLSERQVHETSSVNPARLLNMA